MEITSETLVSILSRFNPWWRGESVSGLPEWRRAAFSELIEWVERPPAPRAIMIAGARQVGKTTLARQAIDHLLRHSNVPASNILYATFDHPILKLAGIDAVLEAWRQREKKAEGHEYLFLDEFQFIKDWGTWVKHRVDFYKETRIVFTGSAMPLAESGQESGVGRWHTIKLTTLSFYEYLQIRNIKLPPLPELHSFQNLFEWPAERFLATSEIAAPYIAHFHEFLVRGGFPQAALIDDVEIAQKLIREDIIDKALKRDMTAVFGVRRVLDLEKTFLYLCMHDGGLLNTAELCKDLEVTYPTAQRYIEHLEASYLIFRLYRFGRGKDVLRARQKIYLADAALASAVLVRGKSALENPVELGVVAETAVIKHLFARQYLSEIRFTYWKDKKGKEVDLIAEAKGSVIPFEVKYREQHTGPRDFPGLLTLCGEKNIPRAYVVTKSLRDFGPLRPPVSSAVRIFKIPATLFCYWLGQGEILENLST